MERLGRTRRKAKSTKALGKGLINRNSFASFSLISTSTWSCAFLLIRPRRRHQSFQLRFFDDFCRPGPNYPFRCRFAAATLRLLWILPLVATIPLAWQPFGV